VGHTPPPPLTLSLAAQTVTTVRAASPHLAPDQPQIAYAAPLACRVSKEPHIEEMLRIPGFDKTHVIESLWARARVGNTSAHAIVPTMIVRMKYAFSPSTGGSPPKHACG